MCNVSAVASDYRHICLSPQEMAIPTGIPVLVDQHREYLIHRVMDNFENAWTRFEALRENLRQTRDAKERLSLLCKMIEVVREMEVAIVRHRKPLI